MKNFISARFFIFQSLFLFKLSTRNFVHSASEEKFDASDLFTDDTQKLEAFGRDVALGGFYDLMNDRMAPSYMNFIHGEIPPWAKKSQPHPFNASRSTLIHRPVDILNNFDVSYQEKANFLLGILPINQERAQFLLWSKRKPQGRKIRGNIIFKFGTLSEKLDIYEVDMENSEPSVSNTAAPSSTSGSSSGPHFLSPSRQRGRPRSPFTHVITGVQYGAVVSIQFEQQPPQDSFTSLTAKQNQNQKQQQKSATQWSDDEIEEHLETQMEIVRNLKKGDELAQKYFNEFPDAPKFNIEITGDIPYDRDGNVEGLSGVLSFIQRVPENLKLIQDGKGYPISFDVTSLKDILANIALNNINSQDSETETETESESNLEAGSGLKAVSGSPSASAADLKPQLEVKPESHQLKTNETEMMPESESNAESDLELESEMTENETE